jgi:hypothetical protein
MAMQAALSPPKSRHFLFAGKRSMSMGEKGTQTNLASEFHVLSLLHRIGAEAHLTLGNKKSVDIFVIKDGKSLAIDVKSIRKGNAFIVGDYEEKASSKPHYFVFVSYNGTMEDIETQPEVFVVPAKNLDGKPLVRKQNNKANNVMPGDLKEIENNYRNNFSIFVN